MAPGKMKQWKMTCEACRAELPNYVRLELANQAADATYPAVAFHLATCLACEAAYGHEFDAQGMAKSLTELQQIGQRTAVASVLDQILNSTPSDIWSPVVEESTPMTGKLWRLLVEIPLLVKETVVVFGQLPAFLKPQLTLVPALRSKSAPPEQEQAAIELLTLPNPEADLLIKLSTGAVINHKSTLIVQLETMAHQPLAQVRTSLRNQNGSLLEQRATDADGLVIFSELEAEKYSIQIKQGGQTWEFSVQLVQAG